MASKQMVGDESPQQERQIDSLADLREPLATETQRLDNIFRVDRQKLKEISARFEQELEEGLQENGRNIPMNLTWVLGFPSGDEQGKFLTLDLGGTNLRVCWIVLSGRGGNSDITQDQYKLPDCIKKGKAESLWDFVADSLEKFVQDHELNGSDGNPLPLGFTFSYPTTQDYIDHGALQTWTKGLDINGVEGNDAAEQLRHALAKRKLPIRLIALINDTTGAMIASAYNDPDTVVGAIFGTGCNAAYMEDCGSIPKVRDLPKDTPMAINCEYGAFDNDHRILPRTSYDETIDRDSPRPGEQTFEKMSAGLYLGEILRLVLAELHQKGLLFKGQESSKLETPYSLDTGFLSAIENDESHKLSETVALFDKELGIDPSEPELEFCRRLAELIAVRGARLCACGIAAICRKKGIQNGHVAADGSVANKHPKFKRRWGQALGEILDWCEDRSDDPIILTSAEDGSGLGAAVIAAMTMERARNGDTAGIRERDGV